MRTGYVNLGEVLESDQPQIPHLEWYAHIPEMNPDDYEINIGRIAALGRLAGVETLKVGSENGEERRNNYSVVGVDSGGTGVSGSSVTITKAPSIRVTDEQVNMYRFDRADQWVVLNNNEIKARVQHKENKATVTDRPFAEQRTWANVVNRSLQDGIFELAKNRYLHAESPDLFWAKARTALSAGFFALDYWGKHKGLAESLAFPAKYFAVTTVLDVMFAPLSGRKVRDMHLNILPGVMFDRVAASGLAASTRVIRPAKNRPN